MSVRTALKVHTAREPDGIAQIAQILARESIPVEALAAVSSHDATAIDLLPTNPEKALKALQQAGLQVVSYRVALAWMPRQPGSLLLACETLAAANVGVDAAYILTTDRHNGQRVGFACSDVDRAQTNSCGPCRISAACALTTLPSGADWRACTTPRDDAASPTSRTCPPSGPQRV